MSDATSYLHVKFNHPKSKSFFYSLQIPSEQCKNFLAWNDIILTKSLSSRFSEDTLSGALPLRQ